MKYVSPVRLIRMALLVVILLVFSSTQILGQDYWQRVPELTSQCYSDQDPFKQTVDELRFEIREKIEMIKQADSEKADNMSQEELMAVAMRYQNMKPEEIVKFQAEMMEMTTLQTDFQEKVTAIEMRYNQLESEFRSEFAKRLGPIEKEARELPDGEGTPQWAIDRAEELMDMYDREYESICQTYVTSADSKFRNWLKDFRTFLVEEEVPYTEKMIKMQYAQYGITADLSAASLEAVGRYLEKSSSIAGLRRPYPQRS